MSNASINAIFGQSHVGGGDPLTIAGMATFQEKIPTLVVAKANMARQTTNNDTFDITGGASDNIAHAEFWLYPHLAHDRFKMGNTDGAAWRLTVKAPGLYERRREAIG
jgi:hypothetical protein